MKKVMFYFSALMLALLLAAAASFAFGPNPKDSNGFKLQQIQPAATTCTTIAAGRATAVSVSVANAPYVNWKTFDSAGAGVVVKRSFNGSASAIPGSSESSVAVAPSVKTFTFTRYTGATAINLCTEK